MSRLNLHGSEAADLLLRTGIKGLVNSETLGGTKTLTTDDPVLQFLDPNAASQVVLLPAEADSEGLMFIIANMGAGIEDLSVKEDSNTTVIATVTFPEVALFVCDGVTWKALLGGS